MGGGRGKLSSECFSLHSKTGSESVAGEGRSRCEIPTKVLQRMGCAENRSRDASFLPRGRRPSCAVCRLISLLCPCPRTAPSLQSGRVLLPQGCVIAALLCPRPSSGFSSEWFFKWPPRPHKFWLPIRPLSAPTCSHLPFADPTPATQAPPCSWNPPRMLLHWCLFPLLLLLLRMLLPWIPSWLPTPPSYRSLLKRSFLARPPLPSLSKTASPSLTPVLPSTFPLLYFFT